MVYLIGTDHSFQYLGKQCDEHGIKLIMAFSTYLEEAAKRINACLIAEEFSMEALQINNVIASTAQKVAQKLNIAHVFCDPTSIERKRLGIERNDFALREQYWLKQIHGYLHDDIIFVCGNSHIPSFCALLHEDGIKTITDTWLDS